MATLGDVMQDVGLSLRFKYMNQEELYRGAPDLERLKVIIERTRKV